MSTASLLPSRSSFLVRGLLFLVIGIICVVWPGISVGVIVALIAILASRTPQSSMGGRRKRSAPTRCRESGRSHRAVIAAQLPIS